MAKGIVSVIGNHSGFWKNLGALLFAVRAASFSPRMRGGGGSFGEPGLPLGDLVNNNPKKGQVQ